jgi:hypothetical protein
MRRLLVLSCLSMSVLVGSGVFGQETPVVEGPVSPVVTEEQPISFWMEKKLEYSKDMLGALAAGQFEEIEKHAERMRLVGKIEGFVRGRSPSYASHLQSFDLATRELKRQARAESIEGATLAFNQLTTSCVTCHQTLREASRNRTSP